MYNTLSFHKKMPHNCCIPLSCNKGYKIVIVDGKEAKVTFHNFPDATKAN